MTGSVTSKQRAPKLKALAPTGSSVFTNYVGDIQVGPWQQSRMSLGIFSPERPAKGFSINLVSDFVPSDAITTHILSEQRGTRSELILHIANRSDKMIDIEIWQM